MPDPETSVSRSKPLSHAQFLAEIASVVPEAAHKRIIQACLPGEELASMERELAGLLAEAIHDED